MKGLNVKKIAALAAGAVFLGSAVAGAALMSDLAPNTTLVNDNGVPQVTVLIPEAGAASDGVAGARIAAKIAYEAYTTKTYTADFSGTPQCEATGEGGETTTTCAVEGQSVTLQIEAPGVAGIYEFSPLIYDVFDKEIGNRDGSKPASTDTYDGDDDEEDASPFFLSTGDEDLLYKIGSDFFDDYPISVSGLSITEKQSVWIGGKTDVNWDDEPEGDIDVVVYSAKFWWGNKMGIPVCTADDGDYWAECEVGTSEDPNLQVDNKQVYINLLGEDWVISDMSGVPTSGACAALSNEEDRCTGGSIKLAKEMVPAQVLSVGDTIAISDSLTLKLTDITLPTGGTGGGIPHAVVRLLGPGGETDVLDDLDITKGTTEDYVAADGTTYKIHVYDAVPGLGTQRWARITVYSREWTLEDGKPIDDDTNEDWIVHLYWKNKDASATEQRADTLREIVFENDNGWELMPNDHIDVVGDPAVYRLTYNGLSDAQMTTLTFEDEKSQKIDLCGCTPTTSGGCKINSDGEPLWIKISTSDGEFDGTNDGSIIYVALYRGNVGGDAAAAGASLDPGDVWVYDSHNDCISEELNGAGAVTFTYKPAGGDYGALTIDTTNVNRDGDADKFSGSIDTDPTNDDVVDFAIEEDIGKVITGDDSGGFTFSYGLDGTTATNAQFQQSGSADSADDDQKAEYTAPIHGTLDPVPPATDTSILKDIVGKEVEEGFVSLRGTEFDTASSSRYQFKFPSTVKRMQFSFTPVGSATNPNVKNWTAVEGDSKTFNDVTITVLSIDPDTVSCGVTGTGSAECTYVEGSAVPIIKETGTPTVDAIVKPASDPSWQNLVMLDTQASGISGNFIAVGGPVVNTVTARELGDADRATLESQKVLIKEVAPTKIIVAGWEAEDTLTAADQFIASMKRV